MTDPNANRKNAIAFYEMMFNDCEPERAIETFVGAEYIQHNPHVKTGKQGFAEVKVASTSSAAVSQTCCDAVDCQLNAAQHLRVIGFVPVFPEQIDLQVV